MDLRSSASHHVKRIFRDDSGAIGANLRNMGSPKLSTAHSVPPRATKDCATDNEIVPLTIARTIFMTMDTGVEIDHVKLKDASARRNYDEKFFHFWPKSFHFPGLVT